MNNNNSPAFPKTDYFQVAIIPPEPPMIRHKVPARYKAMRNAFKNRFTINCGLIMKKIITIQLKTNPK